MTYQAALQALADPTRRTVFEHLRAAPSTVGHLAERLPVSRPAVSQHLRVLKDAGLVREARAGTRRVYSVELQGLVALRRYLDSLWSDVLTAFAAAASAAPPASYGRKKPSPGRKGKRRTHGR